MNEYTASNGVILRVASDDILEVKEPGMSYFAGQATPVGMVALREFFQHERDEALGRWRWPENPDWVIRPEVEAGRTVLVVNEATGELVRTSPKFSTGASEKHRAARAYFAAHPEPKPRPWAAAQFITWRDGAYLWQTAQRDLDVRSLGWRHAKDEDPRWYTEVELAAIIADAEVTILTPEVSE